MNDPRRHTHPPQRAVAFCDYALTDGQFEEYVATADYMSKRQKLIWYLIVWLLFLIPLDTLLFWIATLEDSKRTLFFLLATILLVFIICIALAFIIAFSKEEPPWWGFRGQREEVTGIYETYFGYARAEKVHALEFHVTPEQLFFKTGVCRICIRLDQVLWVRSIGDMVIVGCFNGWMSLTNSLVGFRDEYYYQAVPAAAFLKSKLEGMDPDELIAALEEYAKKPKRPMIRKDAWN